MAGSYPTLLPIKPEQWRDVPGWEGLYQVSDLGRVRSLQRTIVYSNGDTHTVLGRVRKPNGNGHGYLTVSLYRRNSEVRRYIHRLVLEAFVGPCPPGQEACHGNGNPADNRLSNLRWDTRMENVRDTARHGNNFQANKTHCKRGHPLTGNNLILQNGGKRACRECHKETKRRYRARKSASRNLAE